MIDACVAHAVASPSTSAEANSKPRPYFSTAFHRAWMGDHVACVTVIPESNAPSGPPLVWVLVVDEMTVALWRL